MGNEIVKEYLRKYRQSPSLAIAKLLFKEHPELFKNVEQARTMVRYYRGAKGEAARAKLPESRIIDWQPYPITESSAIVSSDFHIPYHDVEAMDIMLDRLAELSAQALILDGDVMDMYQASSFSRDPSQMSLADEMDLVCDFIQGIQHDFPSVKIYYKLGNHEKRWESMLRLKTPELVGFDFTSSKKLLETRLPGVIVINHTTPITYGKLTIIHGHEYGGGSGMPVNPARLMFLKAKKSVLCGHYHQKSEHQEPTISGDTVGAWSIGCMCDLHPEYAPLNKWSMGFAELSLEEDGTFGVRNRSIIDYQLR